MIKKIKKTIKRKKQSNSEISQWQNRALDPMMIIPWSYFLRITSYLETKIILSAYLC